MTQNEMTPWGYFIRPQTFLPREHGGWFLFLVPLAVGAGVAGQWNGRALAFMLAALALFVSRQPLDTVIRAVRARRAGVIPSGRLGASFPAALAWLLIYAAAAAALGGGLLLRDRLWGLAPLALVGGGLLALQMWAALARQARTLWSEVIGTAGLSLAAAGAHYAATGAWSVTAAVLWALTAIFGVGGVLYSRWRLRRRRLAARLAAEDGTPAPPRVSVLSHYGGGLALALALAAAGLVPWAVTPLYAALLARVAWGTRPAARPDRTVLAIGVGEGVATILSGAWLIAAYWI